jgi:anti-anti-sigma regulatory factor
MGLLEASPGVVACEGELEGSACEDFIVALDLLRVSKVAAPIVDLTGVTHISWRGVDQLVLLQSDLADRNRRFKLLASRCVWDAVERVGATYAFAEEDGGESRERGEK